MAISRKSRLWDTPRIVKFGMEHPWAHRLRFRENQFEGQCEDHVLAIKGPCFGHFYERGLWDTPSNVKFGMEDPWAQ